jgi:hypothetical protein
VNWFEPFIELGFKDVIVLDTEYISREEIGKSNVPVFLGAVSLVTGREWRVRLLPFRQIECPFWTGDDVLFVGYSLQAEWSVFLAMGWPLPSRSIDLYAEYMMLTSHLDGEGHDRVPKRKRTKKKAAAA